MLKHCTPADNANGDNFHPAISMIVWKGGMKPSLSEFLLMAIFSQTFFALVRGNLMPFTLFTAGQEFFTSFGEIVL